MWTCIQSLTQMHPKLRIQVFQVLKLQDFKSQQKVIQILTMHQSTWSSNGVKISRHGSFNESSLATY
jgi:hypothetical protein